MITPSIHLNGSNAQDLTDGYSNAYRAVNEAMEAIGKAGPNGRDYYPQGPNAITQAVSEHRARLVALKTVSDELLELAIHCSNFVK